MNEETHNASTTGKFSKLISRVAGLILVVSILFINRAIANVTGESADRQLDFKVFLDTKEIGYHRVNISPTTDGEQVSVEAKFRVKVLFITAFSYLHTAEEQWNDKCLARIDTNTKENGDKMFIRSEYTADGLAISSHQAETVLPGCVRSFAYWDPHRLDSNRLLNTQSGEHVPARLSALGEVIYENDGNQMAAKQYVLEAEEAEINLWYSLDDEWLALETTVKGGRVLAYHRVIASKPTEDSVEDS